jgi:transcriptional regulator with XRE-family HTH domain
MGDSGNMEEHEEARLGQVPIAGLLRQARRRCGMSQRDVARRAGVSPATVGRAESGTIMPSLDVLQRLLDATGLYLVVVDPDGRVIQPLEVFPLARDAAGRRYPAHLDLIIDPEYGEWWGDRFGLPRPPQTFYRDPGRVARDQQEHYDYRAGRGSN